MTRTNDAGQPPTDGTLEALIAGMGLFGAIGQATVTAMSQQLELVRFARQQTVYKEGDHADELFIVASGKIKLGCAGTDGRTHLLAILGPADMFGELSVLDPGPQTATATAVVDASAWSINRDVLQGWVVDHPEVAARLLRLLARRLRRTDGAMCDLVFTDVASRTAAAVLRLAEQFGTQENSFIRVNHDLTQDEIGQLVGATREAVNKVLANFAQRGWVRLETRALVIVDSQRLVDRVRIAGVPHRVAAEPDNASSMQGAGKAAAPQSATDLRTD